MQAQTLQKENIVLNKEFKDQLDYFLGSRSLNPKFEEALVSLREPIKGVLYRGMNFPLYLLEEGAILEEWHGSTHWSKSFEVALGFARDGFLNEDYIEELNEDVDLLDRYGVENSVDLFQEVVFRLKRSTKGVDVHNLVIKLGLTNWIREEEVTFFGTEFVIKRVLLVNDLKKPYFIVDVEEVHSRAKENKKVELKENEKMYKPDIENFKPLVAIMENDNNGEVLAYPQYQNIYIRGNSNGLMIRDHKQFGNLVIAQIEVAHKRQGTGLKILNFLTEYGKENGYSKIIAETVLSPEFQSFLLKNKFKEQENSFMCYELSLVD